MTYQDKYPNCIGCPIDKYCGKAVGATRCLSYNEDSTGINAKSLLALSSSMKDKKAFDDYAAEQIALSLEIM